MLLARRGTPSPLTHTQANSTIDFTLNRPTTMSKKGACCFHAAKGKAKAGAQNHNERKMSYDQKQQLDTKVAELQDCINQLANSGAKKTDIDKLKLSPELKMMVYDAMGIKSNQVKSTEDKSQLSELSIDKKSEGGVDVSKLENDIKKVQSQINELQKDNGRRIGHVFPEKSNQNEIWNISMEPGFTDTKFPQKDDDGKVMLDMEGNIILNKSNVQSYIEEVQIGPNTEFSVNTYQEKLLEDYKASHGFDMRSNGVPLREAIIVGNELTTMDMIKDFCKDVKETYGMQAIHIAIHHDEGHIDRDTEVFKENFHAHVIFDCVNHDNNYSMCRLERKDTANLQTMLSKSLDMERGEVRSAATHFDGIIHGLHEYEKVERNVAFAAVLSARVNPNIVLLDAIKAQAPQTAAKAAEDNKTAKELRIAAKELDIKPALIAANVVKDELNRIVNDKSDENVELIDKLYKKVLTKEDKLNGVPKDAPFEQKVDFIIKKVDEAAEKSDKVTREQDVKIFRPIEHANDILHIDVYKPITDAVIEKADKLSANEKKAVENAQNTPISLTPTPKTERSYDVDLQYKLWNTLKGMGGDPPKVLEEAVNKGLENLQNEIKSANGKLEDANQELQSMTEIQGSIKKEMVDFAKAEGKDIDEKADFNEVATVTRQAVSDAKEDAGKSQDNLLEAAGLNKSEILGKAIIEKINDDLNGELRKYNANRTFPRENAEYYFNMANSSNAKPSSAIANYITNNWNNLDDESKTTIVKNLHIKDSDPCKAIGEMATYLENNKVPFRENDLAKLYVPAITARISLMSMRENMKDLVKANDEKTIDFLAEKLEVNVPLVIREAIANSEKELQKKTDEITKPVVDYIKSVNPQIAIPDSTGDIFNVGKTVATGVRSEMEKVNTTIDVAVKNVDIPILEDNIHHKLAALQLYSAELGKESEKVNSLKEENKNLKVENAGLRDEKEMLTELKFSDPNAKDSLIKAGQAVSGFFGMESKAKTEDQKTIVRLTDEISNLKTEIKKKDLIIDKAVSDAVREERNANSQEIRQLNAKIEMQSSTIETLNQNNSTLQSTIDKKDKQISDLNTEVKTIKKDASSKDSIIDDLRDFVIKIAVKAKPIIQEFVNIGLKKIDCIKDLFDKDETKFTGTLKHKGEEIPCDNFLLKIEQAAQGRLQATINHSPIDVLERVNKVLSRNKDADIDATVNALLYRGYIIKPQTDGSYKVGFHKADEKEFVTLPKAMETRLNESNYRQMAPDIISKVQDNIKINTVKSISRAMDWNDPNQFQKSVDFIAKKNPALADAMQKAAGEHITYKHGDNTVSVPDYERAAKVVFQYKGEKNIQLPPPTEIKDTFSKPITKEIQEVNRYIEELKQHLDNGTTLDFIIQKAQQRLDEKTNNRMKI